MTVADPNAGNATPIACSGQRNAPAAHRAVVPVATPPDTNERGPMLAVPLAQYGGELFLAERRDQETHRCREQVVFVRGVDQVVDSCLVATQVRLE
jgi:hypothetical protein